jgi:hypothetical protein
MKRAVQNFTAFLIALAGFTLATVTARAQISYSYTGNPFTLFSCGPSGFGGTLDCPNAPAPGNPHTSYTATDHVTATLIVSSALAPNLNYQDTTTVPGFQLTMNDGHQTLVTGTASGPFFIAKVSTDANGNIIGPWLLVINVGNAADSGIASENEPPVNPFVQDQGTLACCDPNPPGDIAINQNNAGVWSPGSGLAPTPTYGTVTRILIHDQFPSDAQDILIGDIGQAQSAFTLYSTIGIQAAYPRISAITASNPAGLAAGAWSESAISSGAARGLAFRNFKNITASPITVKVNAVLNGRFTPSPFGLPNGPLLVGGAIHVYQAGPFASALQASHKTAAQYMLGQYDLNLANSPSNAISNLDSLFPGALIAEGTNYLTNGPYNTGISNPFSTTTFTVQPQQTITIVFDVTTVSDDVVLADGTTGGGDVYFLDTLEPAQNPFTDANGNPVTGLAAVDAPPASSLPATPGALTLAPASATSPVGLTATVTALATDTNGAPLKGAIVRFTIESGPNAGVFGAATTDAGGHASFTWPDNQGAGVDTVQANTGSVQSNTSQQTWQGPAMCPHGPGFWKSHPTAWPVSSLSLGGQIYNATQLQQILTNPGGGDASNILAVELIAAKLNIANGSDRSPVASVITAGDNLLAGYTGLLPYSVNPSSTAGQYMIQRSTTLSAYNNGSLTPSCTQ